MKTAAARATVVLSLPLLYLGVAVGFAVNAFVEGFQAGRLFHDDVLEHAFRKTPERKAP